MKIHVLTSNLQKKLSFINHAVSTKGQLPILLNILLETKENTLLISATDLEIGIQTAVQANIEEEGGITVPARLFTELISSLPEETVTLQTNNKQLEVRTKKTKSTLQTIEKEEFPRLFEEKGDLIASFNRQTIEKSFTSVIFAASQDTTRPQISGILIRKETEGFLLVATDGYRLSLKHYKAEKAHVKEETPLIVPSRVFKELLVMKEEGQEISVYIAKESNQVLFEQGETILIGRLIEGAFPQFQKIIPADFSVSVSFEREELQRAVKICSIFARESANIIKLSFQKEQILVSSQSSTLGENTVTIEAVLSGEENEIAFNARYLIDLLANVSAKEMVFEMTGPLNPGVFKIKDDASFLHLIMPIRTQQ